MKNQEGADVKISRSTINLFDDKYLISIKITISIIIHPGNTDNEP